MSEIELELGRLGDALEQAARRHLERDAKAIRRRRTLLVAAVALALVAGVTAALAAIRLGGSSRFEHGRLVLPAQVASGLARSNAVLRACYPAKGATRVEFAGGGSATATRRGTRKPAARRNRRCRTAARGVLDLPAPLRRAPRK